MVLAFTAGLGVPCCVGCCCQLFKLVDQIRIGSWIEILNLLREAIDLLNFYLAQSERRKRCV